MAATAEIITNISRVEFFLEMWVKFERDSNTPFSVLNKPTIDSVHGVVISDYDICSLAQVVVTSTYPKFRESCDIFWYQNFF